MSGFSSRPTSVTELTGTTGHELCAFADTYPAYLQSWQDAIAEWLHRTPQRHS